MTTTTTLPEIDTAATLHVTLDALTALRKLIHDHPHAVQCPGNPATPWVDYDVGDADDVLMTTRAGYVATLDAAIARTTDALNHA